MLIWISRGALAAGLLATPAFAQTAEEVQGFVAAEVRRDGCTLRDFNVVHQGALPGHDRPVVVATYGHVGCGGGNNRTATFGVFTRAGKRVRELPLAEPAALPRVVERVTVTGPRIAVAGADFATDDALCCPSLRRQAEFVVRAGRLVTAPPVPEPAPRAAPRR